MILNTEYFRANKNISRLKKSISNLKYLINKNNKDKNIINNNITNNGSMLYQILHRKDELNIINNNKDSKIFEINKENEFLKSNNLNLIEENDILNNKIDNYKSISDKLTTQNNQLSFELENIVSNDFNYNNIFRKRMTHLINIQKENKNIVNSFWGKIKKKNKNKCHTDFSDNDIIYRKKVIHNFEGLK